LKNRQRFLNNPGYDAILRLRRKIALRTLYSIAFNMRVLKSFQVKPLERRPRLSKGS
jgi:hypothetical protein